eukprot:symbB.v1.2.012870.t1/scaffold875.1/size155714/19
MFVPPTDVVRTVYWDSLWRPREFFNNVSAKLRNIIFRSAKIFGEASAAFVAGARCRAFRCLRGSRFCSSCSSSSSSSCGWTDRDSGERGDGGAEAPGTFFSPSTWEVVNLKARKMKHISTWNGAITDKYYWSQSLQELTLEIEVGVCKASEIKVDVTATRLTVTKGTEVLLLGKLHEKVLPEESIWHLEDEHQVIISLQKSRESWWKCVLEGDPEIDTTKVESTRKLEEYDGETQGAIRKIMFDQNQKLQGKPSSDQIRTAEMMKDAWNAPGSPFRGTEFDPTLLNLSGPVGDDFFKAMEEKRIEGARERILPAAASSSGQ